MVEVDSVTVKYKNSVILDNVTIKIKKGEIIALVGKNGAGKSTLLKTIIGLIPKKTGSIKTSGSIGWMDESSVPDPKLTVHEFLLFCSYLYGKTQVDDVINTCGLTQFCDKLCGELSKGLKQRVMLAGAILSEPEILILDEPSAGLDPLFQKELIEILSLISKNKTMIISTHNISEIETLATKILVLRSGQVSYSGDFNGEKKYYEYF